MLKRKIEKDLLYWKNNRKQALLVTGARQIGKTFSLKHFAEKSFKNAIYLNFADHPSLIASYAELKNPDDLLDKLSLFDGAHLIPGKTVVFFDEIQLVYNYREKLKEKTGLPLLSLDLITAMKPLVIDGRYRFMLSGSLLGVEANEVLLAPVGYMDTIRMFPLDFEEFLWAKGVGDSLIEKLRQSFKKQTPVDSEIHRQMLDLFREYVLVGGMPEAVEIFLKTHNFQSVKVVHEQIKAIYLADMTRYVEEKDKKLKIRDVYEAIPSEVNSKNKRFVNSHVADPGYLRKKGLSDEFLWLTNAGVALPVYNVIEPVLPLTLASERKTLKLFLNDIGLLGTALFDTGVRQKLLACEKEINFGAPYENAVAQELYAHGFAEKTFYYNSKKHGEVDFLLEYQGEPCPIEIKSGKPDLMNIYNHVALNNLIKLYDIKQAFLFGETNVIKENDKITVFPLYMVSFLNGETIYSSDGPGLERSMI